MVGHKVGLSSEAMQKMMNVDEPDYGHLLADMEGLQDVPVKTSDYLYPRVEVEVAFILAEDLPGRAAPRTTINPPRPRSRRRSKLIDTRIQNWQIKLWDTIADNACVGWVDPGPGGCPRRILTSAPSTPC